MSMTDDEQQALDLIERGLRRQDPFLADQFATDQALELRRHRMVWGRRTMIVGVVFTLLGLISADGLISLGTVLCGYGLLILTVGIVVTACHRTRTRGRDSGGWRAWM